MSGWWWLSFCDADRPAGDQFLGVTIVRGINMAAAIIEAHRLGCNPGGEVEGEELPGDLVPAPADRERLLSRDEAQRIAAALDRGTVH